MRKTLFTLIGGLMIASLIFFTISSKVTGEDPKETPTPTPTETPPDPTPDPTPTPTSTPDPKDPCSDCQWDTVVTWSCTNCRDKPGWQYQCEDFDEGGCFGCECRCDNWCLPSECCEPFKFWETMVCGWTVPDGYDYEEGFCACALIQVGEGRDFNMCEGN
ncbi:hypothetical protein JW926_01600 [Candidatus Sumerlaeota bacterium]|nr:hypothetical protein [Candidatus Sumerlaeota bacterium]